MAVEYPYAQWFQAPPACRVCGKPGGELKSLHGNATLAFMCEKHAEQAIKAAHRKGDFYPDEVLREREESRRSVSASTTEGASRG